MFLMGSNRPTKQDGKPPCLSCAMNFNSQGLKCFDWCDKLSFWIQIQDAQREHIRKQEAALRRAAPKKPCERQLREMEQTVEQEVFELIEAIEQAYEIPDEDAGLSDEEIQELADEILRELEDD